MFKQIWVVLLIGWNYWNKLQSFSFACLLQISLKLTSPELHPPELALFSEDKRRGALSSNYGLSTASFILNTWFKQVSLPARPLAAGELDLYSSERESRTIW